MQGANIIILAMIIGAMIAFDMGGPFNKTAFLFGGGMIAAQNSTASRLPAASAKAARRICAASAVARPNPDEQPVMRTVGTRAQGWRTASAVRATYPVRPSESRTSAKSGAAAASRITCVPAGSRPMRALASGNHATAIERNVTMSTNSAMRMPMPAMMTRRGVGAEAVSPRYLIPRCTPP